MDISEYFENYEPENTDRILESGFILDYVPSHSLPNIGKYPFTGANSRAIFSLGDFIHRGLDEEWTHQPGPIRFFLS